MKERKDFRQTLKVEDIPGAQVATLRKGISTNRRLNPIWPFEQYPYLGLVIGDWGIEMDYIYVGAKEDLAEKTGTFLKANGTKAFESKSAVLTQANPNAENQSPVLANPASNKE